MAYSRPLNNLPADFNGQPPIFIYKFVEIRTDGIVINAYRNNREDSILHFYRSQVSENFLDSLCIATNYDRDKSFLEQDPNGTSDFYYLPCLLTKTSGKNVLIEFYDWYYSIPRDLKPIVSDFWKLALRKHPLEISYPQIESIRREIDSALVQRSKLLPPPIKTIIKFSPPKVDSVATRK